MKIHNPIAIQKDGVIFLRYYEQPEPIKPFEYREPAASEIEREYQSRLSLWQSSPKEAPFKDQFKSKTEIHNIYFSSKRMQYCDIINAMNTGIPLDSIADRIEIVDGFAIIKPEEEQESQKQLLQALMEMDRFGTDRILQHFEIRRKK